MNREKIEECTQEEPFKGAILFWVGEKRNPLGLRGGGAGKRGGTLEEKKTVEGGIKGRGGKVHSKEKKG